MSRKDFANMISLLGQIKQIQQSSQVAHEASVCWVPRRTLLSDKVLEEAGVLGEVTSVELPLYFQPLDHDLLSLELDDSFGDLYLVRELQFKN